MKKPTLGWQLGLSAYWFATSFKWFLILLSPLLSGKVQQLVPGGTESSAWGMVISLGAIEACIGPALFGYLSDRTRTRFGSRYPYLVVGTLLTVASLIILGTAESIGMIVFGYFLLQISDDIGTAPYAAMIPELVDPEKRGMSSGVMGGLQQIAQIVAALIALALKANPMQIWIAMAAVNVLGMVIVISVVGKAGMVNVEKSESAGSVVQSWLAPWKIPDFRWVWFTRFLNSAALSPIMSFALYYLQKNIGLTKDEAGSKQLIIAVLLSLIAGISAFATGGLADKWGRKAVVYRSGFVMFTGVLIYAFVPNMSAVWLAVAIFGMGYGAYIGADWALASDIMPNKEDFARDMGMWSMSVPLGQAATGWLFGWIVQVINGKDGTMGYPVLWIICAVIFLFSATLVKKIQGST